MFHKICKPYLNSSIIRKITQDMKKYSIPKVNGSWYPPLDFVNHYGREVTERVLRAVNEQSIEELRRYDISKVRADNIEKYRKANGPFKMIDEILNVNDIEMKILEKFYVSIAEGTMKKESASKSDRPKFLNQLITPKLTKKRSKSIDTVTSICIGTTDISWAQMDLGGKLISWDSFSDFQWPQKSKQHVVHEMALNLMNRLPVSDVYVTEGATLQPTESYSQRCNFVGMLLALSNSELRPVDEGSAEQEWAAAETFYFLRHKTAAQLFGLFVGKEMVSSNVIMEKINEGKTRSILPHVSPIYIDASMKAAYSRSNNYTKEALSQALLVSAAFLDLGVRCNEASFKALRSKSVNDRVDG